MGTRTYTAPSPDVTQVAPAFSIHALGRHLVAMNKQADLLERLDLNLGPDRVQGPLDQRCLDLRRVGHARRAVDSHTDALETLIACSRAVTMEDAVVQLIIATRRLSLFDGASEAEMERLLGQMEGALESVLRVIARTAGMPLAELDGERYASGWCEHWPEIDTSGVTLPPNGAVAPCIDGSTP